MTPKRLARKRLQHLRVEHELSQEAVATKAGIKLARYWYLESAGGPATADEVKAIAKALKVPQRDITQPEATQ